MSCCRRRRSSASSCWSASRSSSPPLARDPPAPGAPARAAEQVGQLTALGADTVAGPSRAARDRRRDGLPRALPRASRSEVRRAGVRVALPQSTLDSAQVLLPGIFIVLVTWLGARLAIDGRSAPASWSPSTATPPSSSCRCASRPRPSTRYHAALVGAQRMLGDARGSSRSSASPTAPEPEPPARERCSPTTRSGLVVEPGAAHVRSSRPVPDEGVRLADRLGRFVDDGLVTLGGVPLAALPLEELRRARSSSARRTRSSSPARCASELDPWGRASDDAARRGDRASRTPRTSSTRCPRGLDGHMEERGRSFSGGQRQRLVLARALLAEAEILILVEPTSAVDAHTEARIAAPPPRRPRGPHDRRHDDEPARARPGRPRRPRRRRPGRRRAAPTASCCSRARTTGSRSPGRTRRERAAADRGGSRRAPRRGRARCAATAAPLARRARPERARGARRARRAAPARRPRRGGGAGHDDRRTSTA